MLVEFVVGSRPCSEGLLPGSLVFLPPQKPTFLNSNSTWNMVATGQEMVREKKFFKVREMSGNFILGQGKLAF